MSNPDDLDDGLLYDFENEELVAQSHSGSDNEEEPQQENENKRPLDEEEEKEEEARPLSKRQKKLQKRSKLHVKKKDQVQYEVNKRKAIPKSTPEEIQEYFTSLIREKNPDLSALELEDLYFKKTDFLSTAKFEEERDLDNLANFMQQNSKAPKAIVFSMSNMRVADVFRKLNTNKDCVKLFAKNKLKDDVKIVEDVFSGKSKKLTKMKYFLATPTRMEKILETTEVFFQGKDKLDVILDASYLDPKDNSLIASENTVLLCTVLKTILKKKSSVKILLY
ncbi:hypothetical protein KAFR_0J00720 [Kazachstania africana CBS 2517]|uniref:Protein CMS1 n=1 Tax=Kazachstania africana (strain ATCC 22294 / BCRC 22015 / CBS 2517 / CECT 1963 / NBRC 1671 / NRRL Y-8276) TaxID=1071382 RepID=H2B0J0_KAZAF|nr:hypothetical protein KAFR_0J00720 [Kazachstania africana CBS 2517]CCF60140.1 hypothetical protein KAFR_0J00720 [Kazachstania africana CBS 2517]